MRSWTMALVAVVVCAGGVEARQDSRAQDPYYRAVARFFEIPDAEMAILIDWGLPAEEIPVVLFVARRAGVSYEAVVALRRSGRAWSELASRYRVDASALHVPLAEDAAAGRLTAAYGRFRSTPSARWAEIELTDDDIVSLVNVRFLSETLAIPPREILARAGSSRSFVEVYTELMR